MRREFTEEQKYLRAKKRVEEVKGFYWNLVSYCLVIPFLFFINYMTSPSYYWAWWPAFGWGIGIVFHAYGVFGNNVLFGKDWEDKKIQEFMDKDSKRNI